MFKMKSKKQKDLKEILGICDKAFSKAMENPNKTSVIEFNGIEFPLVEKLSAYVQSKKDDKPLFSFTIYELKGNDTYEAHIKYKK